MEHDRSLAITLVELMIDASNVMNGRVIETMKVSAVLLFTFTRAVHVPELQRIVNMDRIPNIFVFENLTNTKLWETHRRQSP